MSATPALRAFSRGVARRGARPVRVAARAVRTTRGARTSPRLTPSSPGRTAGTGTGTGRARGRERGYPPRARRRRRRLRCCPPGTRASTKPTPTPRALSDERDAARKRGGLRFQTGFHASARREREAAQAAARRRALRDAARRAAASAATEYVRGALRNAVDAVEDATRACAAHASRRPSRRSPGGSRSRRRRRRFRRGGGAGHRPRPRRRLREAACFLRLRPRSAGGRATPRRRAARAARTPRRRRTWARASSGSEVLGRRTGPGGTAAARRAARGSRRRVARVRADATPATPSSAARHVRPPATPATPATARLGYAFARTTASLVPVKERTAALFLALARLGVPRGDCRRRRERHRSARCSRVFHAVVSRADVSKRRRFREPSRARVRGARDGWGRRAVRRKQLRATKTAPENSRGGRRRSARAPEAVGEGAAFGGTSQRARGAQLGVRRDRREA